MRKLKAYIKSNLRKLAVFTVVFYVLLAGSAAFFVIRNINFNYELDSFFPKGNKNLDFYLEHIKRFETDHDVILFSLTSKKGIFNEEFLKKAQTVCDSIENIPSITAVINPLKMARYRMHDPKPISFPFFHPSQPEKYDKDSLRLLSTKHFVSGFVSFSSSSLCFIAKVRPELNIDSSKLLVNHVKSYLESRGFDHVRLSGRVKAQTYIVSKMQNEFILLAGITAIALIIFLYLTFRNFWGVILPFMVVNFGMIFTLTGILLFSGSLNLISVILPTVLFVVGVSDAVHVLNSYYTELNNGHDKIQAISLTIREIGRATFLTAITSAIGFFTLITVNVKPIADFGVYAALGIMIIYVISFTFLIAMLVLVKPFYLPERKELIKHEPFRKLFHVVLKRKIAIAILFIALLFPLITGVFQINVNNYFTEDFRKSDPHKVDFDFFDQHFYGVRPYEVSLQAGKGKKITDFDVVKEMGKFEDYLRDSIHVGGIFSTNTVVKLVNQMNNKGEDGSFDLSLNDSSHHENLKLMFRFRNEFSQKLVDTTNKFGRITGRINDIGAIEVRKLHAKLDEFYKNNIDHSLFSFRHTGISEIIDGNIKYLTANMMDGLIYELIVIGVLMGLLFRSVKMMFLSLIPNIFPLLFIGGVMGWLGINLNVSSSIIFSIAFGITVDDTIHLLGRYKIELSKGLDNKTALLNAYMYSGKAVVMTSVILFSGFSILMLSTFTGIFNTGLLVGLTLLVAVVSDLLLLPLLFGSLKK